MIRAFTLILVSVLSLSACGRKGDLTPPSAALNGTTHVATPAL